jgi:hypothetical protein
MNTNPVARHYGSLTPEERFRLIVAAGARGDEAERQRLTNAGRRITLSMPDHAPLGHAFHELALLIFIELLEEAARYLEALDHAEDVADIVGPEDEEEDCGEAEDGGGNPTEGELDATADSELAEDYTRDRPAWQRSLDIALAAGFMLRTKADGWMLFCERMSIPPFAGWEGLPGFDRLQRALKVAEQVAFVPEGMVRWLNAIRPQGAAEVTAEGLLSVQGYADGLEKLYRQCVAWWGG